MSRYLFSPLVAIFTFLLGLTFTVPVWFPNPFSVEKTFEPLAVPRFVSIPELPEINAYIIAERNNTEFEDIEEYPGVYGYFYIPKKSPREFRNLDYIALNGSWGAKQNPPSYGWIMFKNKAPITLFEPTFIDNKISFRSETVKGISYEFSGTFKKNFQEISDEEIVMKGILKKIKAGKTVSESKVRFSWHLGC